MENKLELTKMQTTVLKLTFAGLTGNQIAKRLTVTTRTVYWHREEAYKRLKVHNTIQALLVMLRHNMIDVNEIMNNLEGP